MKKDSIKILLLLSLIVASLQQTKNLRSQWQLTEGDQIALGSSDEGLGFLGFLFGPILFILSFAMIWYNQKRAAINTSRFGKIKTLLEESQAQKKTEISQNQIGQEKLINEATVKLIHLSGTVQVLECAQDPITKLSVEKAIRLDRSVQVMEYRAVGKDKEQHSQLGWYTFHISQANGKRNDEANWFFKSETFTAKKAKIQNYFMNEQEMKSQITNFKVTPTAEMADSIKESVNRHSVKYLIDGQYIYFPAEGQNKNSHGTLRVKFNAYKPEKLSILASHNQQTLQAFRIDLYENKGKKDTLCCQGVACCCGCNAVGQLMKPISEVDFVMEGTKSANEMIEIQLNTNKKATYLLRLASYLVMVFGIYLFFTPLVEILGYIPLVGGFIKGAVGSLIFLAALIVCIPLFILTFSFAWLVYHPKFGILALFLAGVIITIIIVLNEVYQDQ